MHLKLSNGIPEIYSIGNLRRDNPQTSFPRTLSDELLASYDVYPYVRTAIPNYEMGAWRLGDDDFVYKDESGWVLPYKLEKLPLEEAQSNLRQQRDQLLATSDWIVVKCYEQGVAVPEEWATYRQALRDLTTQEDFPYNIAWPQKP